MEQMRDQVQIIRMKEEGAISSFGFGFITSSLEQTNFVSIRTYGRNTFFSMAQF